MTTDDRPERLAPSVDDAIYAIRAYVAHRGWSVYELARQAGIARTSLVRFEYRMWAPKTETLRALYSIVPHDFDPASVAMPVIHDERNPAPPRRRKKKRVATP